MYESFRIQHFRGFEDLQLDDLARVNLIAGKNNTGKTALLEAIALHTGMYIPQILLRMDINRIKQNQPQGADIGLPAWITLFKNFNAQNKIRISGKRAFAQRQLSLFPQMDEYFLDISTTNPGDVPESSLEYSLLRDFDGWNFRGIDVLKLNFSSGGTTYIFKSKEKIIVGDVSIDWFRSVFLFAREYEPLDSNARRFSELKRLYGTQVVNQIMKCVDPRIEGLELLYDGFPPLIYADIGLNQPVPLISMGDGVNRALSIILAMNDVRDGGVILIDEIENGLHHSVQKDFWDAIAEAAANFNVQVFATTHSREMAMAAHRAFESRDEYNFRYHRLDRDKKTGQIYPTTYDQLTMNDAMEMGAEVR